MFKIFTGVLLSAAVSTSALAQSDHVDSSVRVTGEGVVYSVAPGETLSVIARRFTGEMQNWHAIGRVNGIANDRTIPIGRKILIPARLLTPISTFAKVQSYSGKVSIRSKDGSSIETKIGALLKEGDTLTTQADSFISLVLDDGTQFTLPPNSELSLKLLRTTQYVKSPRTQLYLQKGRVESHVIPFTKPDSRYEVVSPLAVSGVRGTNFRVNSDDRRTLNEVIEGKVAVRADHHGQKNAASPSQLVAAGYGTVVENGRMLRPVALLPAPAMADGYQLQQRLPIQFALSQPQASAFRARISAGANEEDSIAETTVSAIDGKAVAKISDLPDGVYYVHYNAVDDHGLSGLRGTLRFRVAARPFPPFLQSPGAKYQGSDSGKIIPVTMKWALVEDVSRYRLQISRDESFSNILTDEVIDASREDGGERIVPLEAGIFYWRVASIVSDGGKEKQGPFSDGKKVDVLKPQAAPETAIGEHDVHFAWPASEGQRFTFQVSDTPTFGKLIANIETDKPEAAIRRPDAGTYYARVRSTDADGFVGAYSPAQKFVIPIYWQTGYGVPVRSQEQPLGTGF